VHAGRAASCRDPAAASDICFCITMTAPTARAQHLELLYTDKRPLQIAPGCAWHMSASARSTRGRGAPTALASCWSSCAHDKRRVQQRQTHPIRLLANRGWLSSYDNPCGLNRSEHCLCLKSGAAWCDTSRVLRPRTSAVAEMSTPVTRSRAAADTALSDARCCKAGGMQRLVYSYN
jgi:hypothetical protein